MRTLKIVVGLLVAVAVLAGCGLFGRGGGPSQDEQLQKLIDANASFTVFLRDSATAAQRTSVEAALRALPGATGVAFEDHDEAYRRMKDLFSADPSGMPQIEPENLPETFKVSMTDIAAVQKVRDDPSALKKLPGVLDVIFTCTTVAECKAAASPKPAATPS